MVPRKAPLGHLRQGHAGEVLIFNYGEALELWGLEN